MALGKSSKDMTYATTTPTGSAVGTSQSPRQRTPHPELPTYLLLVLRGLEFLVVEEIRSNLQIEYLEICSIDADEKKPHINVYESEAAVGRILLQTRSSVEEVRSLRSIQAFLAFICRSDAIVTSDKSGVAQVAKMVSDADWAPAMQLWYDHMNVLRPGRFKEGVAPSFRGSCVRDGKHAFKSVAIAGEVGTAVINKFGWAVNLAKCDLEIVCFLFHEHMITGISLANPEKIQFRNRMAIEDRSIMSDATYVSTLRPSTAYLMLRLAKYEVGDVLLDSMCGVGTIPVCCADLTTNSVFALGGELESDPAHKAGENARARPHSAIGVCNWDSTRLPLRNECVDRVVIDLPFGIRCGTPRQLSKIYPKVLKELYRVMRPGGRAVLLTALKKTFLHSISLVAFTLEHSYEVNIGGLLGIVYVLEKPRIVTMS